MPLGPRHAVALARNSVIAELTPDQVDRLNRYQVEGALEYVYFQPGSGLERFACSIVGSNGA
jgi:hypothetical protein